METRAAQVVEEVSSILKCDHCGKVSQNEEPLGWIHIEPIGTHLFMRGGMPALPEGDYCSIVCAVAKLQEYAPRLERGMPQTIINRIG